MGGSLGEGAAKNHVLFIAFAEWLSVF